MADRLVGDRPDVFDDTTCKSGRRLRLDDHNAVVTGNLPQRILPRVVIKDSFLSRFGWKADWQSSGGYIEKAALYRASDRRRQRAPFRTIRDGCLDPEAGVRVASYQRQRCARCPHPETGIGAAVTRRTLSAPFQDNGSCPVYPGADILWNERTRRTTLARTTRS
jgi:hypothetical protein